MQPSDTIKTPLTPMRHATKMGLYLGLFFIAKYLCVMYTLEYPLLFLVYLVATLAVPFIAYRYTRLYRDSFPERIGFPMLVAWSHGLYLYLFATILVLIPHYIYYSAILPEQIVYIERSFTEAYAQNPKLQELFAPLFGGLSVGEYLRQWLAETSVGRMLWSDFSTNIFFGSILSLINAAILRRKPSIPQAL